MNVTESLLSEIRQPISGEYAPYYYLGKGFRRADEMGYSPIRKRAEGIVTLFTEPSPYIYPHDLVVGSIRPLVIDDSVTDRSESRAACDAFPNRWVNIDHFTPDYRTALTVGIPGLLARIADSKKVHASEPDRVEYLDTMEIALTAFKTRLSRYAEKAEELLGTEGYDDSRLTAIRDACRALTERAPESFLEAIQLVWMLHNSFVYEGRYAMALGRFDQYLYPFYRHDMDAGVLTDEEATRLVENVFAKIHETQAICHYDDVVNIAIGGVDKDLNNAVNGLTYCVLEAVKNLQIPGPNLSARIPDEVPEDFLDACLKVIGTGVGYPALMNDRINRAALLRKGYDPEDVWDYSMVGCIENFLSGCQCPWTDGRFDTPRFLEYIFYPEKGPDTGSLSEITSMEIFMEKFEEQIAYGAEGYMEGYRNNHTTPDEEIKTAPFLSCFCYDCIGRGLDINLGGAKYPSAYGAVLMGVGTTCDSLAAIEKVVFDDKEATLEELAEAMRHNFVGYEELRKKLLAAPKYGNNDPYVDKYAPWFVEYQTKLFDQYQTHDGGHVFTAMAANTSNIYAGAAIGATPDGRLAGTPLSDAASPTYGRDVRGFTATINSLTRADYSCVACGSVVNQKFSPSAFNDENRPKLLAALKVYFLKGGQEMQINSTDAKVLKDAMDHPENYPNLVVRVSGFSAIYVTLSREVQEDILNRTQKM